MSDFREEEKLGKVYDAQLTRRLLKYLRPYMVWVWVAISMTIGVAVVGSSVTQVREVLASVERFVVAAPDVELIDIETGWLEQP